MKDVRSNSCCFRFEPQWQTNLATVLFSPMSLTEDMFQSPHIVELLLRFGAPVNAVDIGGYGFWIGLRNAICDVSCILCWPCRTNAVHFAAQHGFVRVLERLILGGADCNKANRNTIPSRQQ
jgi:hypothetical protein